MSRHTRHTHVHVLLKQFAGFLVVRWPQVGRSLNGAMGTAPSLACQAQHRRCHQMHHHAPITTRATTWVAPNAALRGWHINTKPRTGRVETFRECAIEVGNHLWQKGRSELPANAAAVHGPSHTHMQLARPALQHAAALRSELHRVADPHILRAPRVLASIRRRERPHTLVRAPGECLPAVASSWRTTAS